ncbi:vacuolar iron transporter homolog 4-like [Vigna radiata var. radiata]|uniref:Vacuolar iron transporter n=1 Tax=Vigna radiata var. radiata TaxID=3916 RepID=A0A1S3T8N0_VIGRR|nr:vacuolar iron transporter homolog 4-like [Vigna radiata var. radiata]
MDSLGTSSNEMPINHVENLNHSNDIEANPNQDMEENNIEYSEREHCLGLAVFGAKTGLFITTLLMIAIEALNENIIVMLLAGFLGVVVGACSMPVEGFVSVDTEVAQMKVHHKEQNEMEEDDKLLNPFQASLASAIGFSIGGMVSVLTAAFIRDYKLRLLVISLAMLALLVFGGMIAVIRKSKTLVRRNGDSGDWRLYDYGYYFWL